jgi:hypothetical protein
LKEIIMGFKRAADGITAKGKTKGKNLGDDGKKVGIQNGPAKHTVGKTNVDMKRMGRNLAKIAAQKRG